MKDLVTSMQKNISEKNVADISAISLHILVAFLGFIVARATIFESMMPFGLIFVGGCTAVFLPSTAIGAFLGYFIPATSSGGFRYIAAMLAVLALRLLLSGYKKLCANAVFLGAATVISNLVTGAVVYSGIPLDAIKLAAECIVVFCAVFVVHNAFRALSKEGFGFSDDEFVCLIGTAVIILMGAFGLSVFGISLGRVFGVILILVAAKYGGIMPGSACGIALSLACALTNSFEGGFGVYAFAGLAAGLFLGLGKFAQAISMVAMGIIGLAFMRFGEGSGSFITEILIGSAIFVVIPRSIGIHLGKLFYRSPKLNAKSGTVKAVSLRLALASDALKDVSSTVCQVSQELGKINAPDFKTVISFIEQDACMGCKLRLHCWENKNAQTFDAIMQMINCIKGGDIVPDAPALAEFRGRCLRVKRMEDTVKYRYSQYASMLAAENRIEEVRQVVSEQFEGISDMLQELVQDLSGEEHFNGRAATACAAALKNIGIHTQECCAKIDKFGRMSLEIKVKSNENTVLNRLQIMKILSLACERDFDIPSITKIGDSTVITVNEHASYRIDVGVGQHPAVAGSICGDSCRYFNDGKGHFVMVLSDGMGTGGRAAVDGAMASGLMARLLKAGFGYDCSLKILNSSMLFKSSDESLATMDIASIDLFTGNTELYKAGAAPTLVRRNGHSGRAESNSLPIGILKEVSFDRAGIRLRQKDILLLVSDGVTFDGTEWIREELDSWGDGGAQDLAEHICDCARRRYTNTRPDDITVMAAIIEKTPA